MFLVKFLVNQRKPYQGLPQNLPISFIPATLNQNTEFTAWCNPTGINNLLKNPYIPTPTGPNFCNICSESY